MTGNDWSSAKDRLRGATWLSRLKSSPPDPTPRPGPWWIIALLGLVPAACGAQLSHPNPTETTIGPAPLAADSRSSFDGLIQLASAEQVAEAPVGNQEPPAISSPYGALFGRHRGRQQSGLFGGG